MFSERKKSIRSLATFIYILWVPCVTNSFESTVLKSSWMYIHMWVNIFSIFGQQLDSPALFEWDFRRWMVTCVKHYHFFLHLRLFPNEKGLSWRTHSLFAFDSCHYAAFKMQFTSVSQILLPLEFTFFNIFYWVRERISCRNVLVVWSTWGFELECEISLLR